MNENISSGRILVVDDDALVVRCHSILLIRAGFNVTAAGDGREALAWLETSSFDAVVSDINMPQLDGLGLLLEIRRRYLSLPVILVSGTTGSDIQELGMACGATAVFEKPLDFDQLIDALALARAQEEQRFAAPPEVRSLECWGIQA